MTAGRYVRCGAAIVDIAERSQRGHWVRDTAAAALPPIAARLIAGARRA